MFKLFLSFCLLTLLTGCFKTAEEIQREKKVDQMLSQQEQSAQIIAGLTQHIQTLQSKLTQTSGQIEEIDYKSKTNQEQQGLTLSQSIQQLQEQVKALSNKVESQQKDLSELSSIVKKQNKYIKKVNNTLSDISSDGTDHLKKAHSLFEKNDLKGAKESYEEVLANSNISAAEKNHVYYNLGIIEYRSKNYDQALVLFSKIYTKFPKSSWAPRALLFIAHSFNKKGKNDEAQATYNEVIKNYPGTKQAKDAKKELK